MFLKSHIEKLIRETLKEFKSVKLIGDNDTPVKLLLGTMAQESAFGKYKRQLNNGPALGVFQMEPDTFNDILDNYISYRPDLYLEIKSISKVNRLYPEYLVDNLKLAIVFARLQYYRHSEPLPRDLPGMARYWKKYYNTYKGKGTIDQFILNYKTYVSGE